MTYVEDASDPSSAFWQFSLALYRHPGVPDICIALQDNQGVDVNVLFYLLFRAMDGTSFNVSKIAALDGAVAPWRAEVVQPLRQARRALKRPDMSDLAQDDDALRLRVKSAELEAERLQQQALVRIGATFSGVKSAGTDSAIATSCRAYGAHLETVLPDSAIAELATAIAAAVHGRKQ